MTCGCSPECLEIDDSKSEHRASSGCDNLSHDFNNWLVKKKGRGRHEQVTSLIHVFFFWAAISLVSSSTNEGIK